jgi:hypothetical protein
MPCACTHDCSLDRLRERQRGTLRAVLALNAVMFFAIAAAGAVWLTRSGWPDLAVAGALVILLMRSALRVIAPARAELPVAA